MLYQAYPLDLQAYTPLFYRFTPASSGSQTGMAVKLSIDAVPSQPPWSSRSHTIFLLFYLHFFRVTNSHSCQVLINRCCTEPAPLLTHHWCIRGFFPTQTGKASKPYQTVLYQTNPFIFIFVLSLKIYWRTSGSEGTAVNQMFMGRSVLFYEGLITRRHRLLSMH